jgi:hypothetical protein
LALVALSVVEQRLGAVLAVLVGADVVHVAERTGVHWSAIHWWVGRHLTDQLGGLVDPRRTSPFIG